LSVYDSSNNKLGTFVGLCCVSEGPPNGVTVYQNGLFVNLDWSGYFPVGGFNWTANNCTGTPYLNDGFGGGQVAGTNQVVYSAIANKLYVLAGSGASATSVAVGGLQGYESAGLSDNTDPDGSANCQATSNSGGWAVSTSVNANLLGGTIANTLGWTTISGNPLRVGSGSIKIQ
jgi:hypothetical protein